MVCYTILEHRCIIKTYFQSFINECIPIAAENGDYKILGQLLNFDKDTTMSMIDKQTDPAKGGFAPIHYAVKKKCFNCVFELICHEANVCLKTNSSINDCITPFEIAIEEGYYKIAEFILSTISDRPNISNTQHLLIERANDKGWFPLHLASQRGQESFIKLLLKYDASLVLKTKTENPETALDIIIQHVTNPTNFLEGVLDSYISLDDSPDRAVVDYKILMPSKSSKEEMEVIDELLKTGNKFEQKRLLLHPLIESFIYLKRKALMPFYFMTATIYLMFMILLAIFALTVFDRIDKKNKPERLKLFVEVIAIFIFIAINITYEVLINFEGRRYFWKLENIVKLSSLALATIFSLVIFVQGWEEGARHVATGAMLLASIQMLNILSQCPPWGFYVVMFQKVTCNVAKILVMFAILIIGFAFSFKLQLHSQIPYDGPWHAIVKTLVLLTSEFNYDDIFEAENSTNVTTISKENPSPNEGTRFIFVVFLILIAIVLMNVMTGVAVDDINDLKTHGSIGSLEKQASFLRSIEKLKYKLTDVIQSERSQFPETIDIEKDTVDIFIFRNVQKMPKRFKDAFFSIAQKNKDRQDLENTIRNTESKLEGNQSYRQDLFINETKRRLDALEKTTAENASQMKDMNHKLDLITRRSSEIMQFLISLKKDKKAGM